MQKIVIHTTEEEILQFLNVANNGEVFFETDFNAFLHFSADVFIDLNFINTPERVKLLSQVKGLVIINSVVYTVGELELPFVRINAWPGCVENLVEASCLDSSLKRAAETTLQRLGKKIHWLPDEPGFVTPRVICMIINEAFFALEEELSSKEEIDTAMKLGTAYPYGPFEWGKKIGLSNIVALLKRLNIENQRYEPAPLLIKEALSGNS